ncbi:MAG TPA: DUF6345 domain-containing protein [Saprospiraceae bacterium]|nr:DUF6345 domain-containing protein [Saprospiraceae bacterium]
MKQVIFNLILLCVLPPLFSQTASFNGLSIVEIMGAASSMSNADINGNNNSTNQIPTGTILIYLTNEGRFGKMFIQEYGYNLKIAWKTYDKGLSGIMGNIYSSGTNLVIKGTWACDLDKGMETQNSKDFWWQQTTDVLRVFNTQNGARFKVYVPNNEDSDHQFAGYVSNEENRFVDYVWGFVDEFENKWQKAQYYWGESRFIGSQHLSFADAVDLVYIAGHGSPSGIWMNDKDHCWLYSCAWGSYSSADRTGDLEYIVFHSCSVLKMDEGWRERWRNYNSTKNDKRPFQGLHVAMGFRTTHHNGLGAGWWAADEFAENLEDGYSVRYAWYEAAEDARWLAGWDDNKPAIFYIRPHKNQSVTSHNGLDYHYGDADYLLDAYFMK